MFVVRTKPFIAPGGGDDVLLDFAPGSARATVQAGRGFFQSFTPTRAAADLMLLSFGAYVTDRTSMRSATVDAWTRDLHMQFPVQTAAGWPVARAQEALRFLTGDRWSLTARQQPAPVLEAVADQDRGRIVADGVCLFSGGLDSLCGVISLLETDPSLRLCLLSHYEGGQTPVAQLRLWRRLSTRYGRRVTSLRLFLRPAPANPTQARALPESRETTTRSRSAMFLSTALAVASSLGPDTPVYLPENGYIGLNAPLTRARAGSLSTRTTHPHFLTLFTELKNEAGVTNPLINPYRLMTKGEMLTTSPNQALLQELAPASVSCSHPEAARYDGRTQGNCGYCFPCLIRRASMAKAGWDQATDYAWDALTDAHLLDATTRRSADLRAVIAGTRPGRPAIDVLRNGPLPRGERHLFLDVWRRGSDEVRSWLTAGAQGDLADLLDTDT
ncbi:Qat anti-phage system QueC-like protein QatC [Streptomyces sp. SM13]|uniref:Qat anti-phage system QueC-like protein QatC n=1 Tax=Streptomyces sp. SM13 TaxID=1983803 RepID=UPI002156390E|nr:Qat anti-phage system QueC-like protein QatC [Streptomyces sp. SM13]